MDLAEFLLARIGEDEAAANDALSEIGRWGGLRPSYSKLGFDVGDLAQTYNPTRVLAECDAKRRIVDGYREVLEQIERNADGHAAASRRALDALPSLRTVGWQLRGRSWGLEIALRALALPYADHPDYQPEWKV